MNLRVFSIVVLVLFSPQLSAAAIINVATGLVEGDPGKLDFAKNVVVDGSLYDVQFTDGSCFNLFAGCKGVGGFVFDTEASAIAASQALMGQVFGGAFDGGEYDTNPFLTQGIDLLNQSALIITPYDYHAAPILSDSQFRFWSALNAVSEANDGDSGPGLMRVHTQTFGGIQQTRTFAVWTPVSSTVPEPATLALLGLGLAGLGFARRNER